MLLYVFLICFLTFIESNEKTAKNDVPTLACIQNGELFSLLPRNSKSIPEKYRELDSDFYFMSRMNLARAWDGNFDLGYVPVWVLDRGFPKIRLSNDVFWVVHDHVQIGNVIESLRGFPLSEFPVIHAQNPQREKLAIERFNNRNRPCLTVDCRIDWTVNPILRFLSQTRINEDTRRSRAFFSDQPEPKPIVLREFYDVLPSSLTQCELFWISDYTMSIYHGTYNPDRKASLNPTKWEEKPNRRLRVPFSEDFWVTRTEGDVYFLTESGMLYQMSKEPKSDSITAIWKNEQEPIRFAITDNHSGKVFAFTKPNKAHQGKVLLGLSTKPIDFNWSKIDRSNGWSDPKILYDLSRWLIDHGHVKVK